MVRVRVRVRGRGRVRVRVRVIGYEPSGALPLQVPDLYGDIGRYAEIWGDIGRRGELQALPLQVRS